MNNTIRSIITGTGSYIPPVKMANEDFLSSQFFDSNAERLEKSNQEIIEKFLEITTIAERRYVDNDQVTSDIASIAAQKAINSAGIDPEELDYIIVAHNFGDIKSGTNRIDLVPALAARVKHKLGIENPNAVAYDIIFGCPGWLQALIQADYYLRSGDARKVLVIGADVLSRIADPYDRDGMIYADGAGAVILEASTAKGPGGILAHKTRSDTLLHSGMLYMGGSNSPGEAVGDDLPEPVLPVCPEPVEPAGLRGHKKVTRR